MPPGRKNWKVKKTLKIKKAKKAQWEKIKARAMEKESAANEGIPEGEGGAPASAAKAPEIKNGNPGGNPGSNPGGKARGRGGKQKKAPTAEKGALAGCEEAGAGAEKKAAGEKKAAVVLQEACCSGVPRAQRAAWGDEGAPGGFGARPKVAQAAQAAVAARPFGAGGALQPARSGGAQPVLGGAAAFQDDDDDDDDEVAARDTLLNVIHTSVDLATALYSGSESEKYEVEALPANVHFGCPEEGCFACFDNPEALQDHKDVEHMGLVPLERVKDLVTLMCNTCIDHELPKLVREAELAERRAARRARRRHMHPPGQGEQGPPF